MIPPKNLTNVESSTRRHRLDPSVLPRRQENLCPEPAADWVRPLPVCSSTRLLVYSSARLLACLGETPYPSMMIFRVGNVSKQRRPDVEEPSCTTPALGQSGSLRAGPYLPMQ